MLDELERQGLVVFAGKGYQGNAWAKVPCKGKNQPGPQKSQPRPRETPRTRRRANDQFKT